MNNNMTNPVQLFSFSGGIDRSRTPIRSDLGTFYNLVNFRQQASGQGALMQTPYFFVNSTTAQGTYYNSGSLTEPSTSAVRGYLDNVAQQERYIVTDYCLTKSPSTQLQVLYQTTVPTTSTINTQCFIVVNSITGLNLTLGLTLDVVIDGTTTFKWRKNGGGYTALVPITTAGVSIDGGNATVYFLTATDFNVNDTWSWQRTDCMFDATFSTNMVIPTEFEYYKTETFLLNHNRRLMVIKNSTTGSYCISCGYRPVYGTHFTVFEGHIFLTGFATVPYSLTTSLNSIIHTQIGNSDNVDIQNFFATDINEADTYSISTGDVLVGIGVLNSRLFVCTLNDLFYTDYVGLPTPFDFRKFDTYGFCLRQSGFLYFNTPNVMTLGRRGNYAYFVSNQGVLRFDGTNLLDVGNAIYSLSQVSGVIYEATPGWQGFAGFYDEARAEFVMYSSKLLYVFQERFSTWYTRGAAFQGSGSDGTCCVMRISDVQLGIGTKARVVLKEDVSFGAQPVVDSPTSNYTVPTITTSAFIGEKFATVKETCGTYIAAEVVSCNTSFYTTDTSLNLQLYWYPLNSGTVPTSVTDSNAVWNTIKPDGLISYPRVAFHGLMLEIRAIQITTKPPGYVKVYALEPIIRNEGASK